MNTNFAVMLQKSFACVQHPAIFSPMSQGWQKNKELKTGPGNLKVLPTGHVYLPALPSMGGTLKHRKLYVLLLTSSTISNTKWKTHVSFNRIYHLSIIILDGNPSVYMGIFFLIISFWTFKCISDLITLNTCFRIMKF